MNKPKKIFNLLVTIYLIYFLVSFYLIVLHFYLRNWFQIKLDIIFWLVKESFIPYLLFLILFAILFKIIYKKEIMPNKINDYLLKFSRLIFYIIILCLVIMIILGATSKNLWENFRDILVALPILFIVPVIGFAKNNSESIKWKFLTTLIYSYIGFILAINFSMFIGLLIGDVLGI